VPENTYKPTPGLDDDELADEEELYAKTHYEERMRWDEAHRLMQQVRSVARSLLTLYLS